MTRSHASDAQGGSIVRMKDIAKRGNVSLATVSQVLRGHGADRYSQATRDKIVRVANELGWSPNRLVRGIQTGRTGMAGDHPPGLWALALHRRFGHPDGRRTDRP